MTVLEPAEMRLLRSVKGYTRLDKIRSEVIRKELEISGIEDVRAKYKQNWINHLEGMDNTRLPKHALNYKPRGRRDRGRPKKRWQRVDAGTGQATLSMEEDDETMTYFPVRRSEFLVGPVTIIEPSRALRPLVHPTYHNQLTGRPSL